VNSEKLFEMLRYMGLRRDSAQVLVLLPLIEVAWADGVIQQAERDLILSVARYQFDFSDDALDMLDAWLSERPKEDYLVRGREVLKALAMRSSVGLSHSSLDDVLKFCNDVASASGGFFGVGRIHHRERAALRGIGEALRIRSGTSVSRSVDAASDSDLPSLVDSTPLDLPPKWEMAEPLSVEQGLIATLVSTEGRRRSYPCGESGLTLGRSRSNTVPLRSDGKVSRRHTEILVRKGVFYAQDLGSANGTWVNGLRIRRRPLFGDEIIRVGHSEFKFLVYLTIQDVPAEERGHHSESLPDISMDNPLEDLIFQHDPYGIDDEDSVTAVDDCEETEEADFSQLSVKQLKAIAKGRGIKGYSRMKKSDLVDALLVF
jgi:pSer/pThr/pTyr-binding forkhead associated (FHA) protein/tellurite resistance protein